MALSVIIDYKTDIQRWKILNLGVTVMRKRIEYSYVEWYNFFYLFKMAS